MGLTECKGYDYISLKKLEKDFCKRYPFLQSGVQGRSCMGRDISSLQLGKTGEYVLITAAFHGSEYITTTVLMYFIEELCEALLQDGSIAGFQARKAMYGRGVIFIPCVNPDGCEIAQHGRAGCGKMAPIIAKLCKNDFEHWNANIRGVDINHNFNAGWQELHKMEQDEGIYAPSPTRFGGFRAESEPETLTLTELCRTKHIRHVIALHSQGEVIYWTYGNTKPPKSRKMAEIMATSAQYELAEPEGLAVGGGFKDWFISEFNRPGFTVEIGRGENPLPIDSAYNIYSRVRELLMLSAIM